MKQIKSVIYTILGLLIYPAFGVAQDFDNIEITTIPVKGSIYMLQGSGGNIGVSIGDDGTFIIDDQFAPLTDKIVAAIAELTDKPVNFVVNSHWHYDHTDGNENFGRAGAYIVAQDNSRKRMETDQVVSLTNRDQLAYAKEGLPKITFMDSMRFYFNDNTIDVVYTGPGHTDGDAQVYFRELNVIHTGDMFVRYGLPFIDQPNGGSTNGMIDALWDIAGLIDDDTIIIPGHGQLSTRTDLLEYRTMLTTIRARLKEEIANGRTADQVVASNPARGYAQAGAGTERWLRAAYEEYK
ncbi:MAG: MBL fold metallo-hydrolase [SAR86 cluster bacterium]|uniref:MBL fold metallo-hydrolase n=1 Tax=SAR86 cluster bacterium TaxID=2030880 RepID=A0A2A5ASW8_9GAMM|nr:MAG: MBL fold metallo-hydrolase [SAR86 cluster bacterium]